MRSRRADHPHRHRDEGSARKRGKWGDEYEPVVRAARSAGIEVLARIGWNTLVCGEGTKLPCCDDGMPSDPMALTDERFEGGFVAAVNDAMDRVADYLPDVKYVEDWNEPDVYWFTPLHHWPDCSVTKAAQRHGIMMSRVCTHVTARREACGAEWPKVLGSTSRGRTTPASAKCSSTLRR